MWHPGGGGALGYGLTIMCRTTLGSGGGGRDSKGEIGGGDPPTISIIGGLNLLELPVSLCFYSNMLAKRYFRLQEGLIGKFAIVWSGFQCSVAVKTGGGQSQLPCTGGGHFHQGGRGGAVGRHMLATLKESVPPPPGCGIYSLTTIYQVLHVFPVLM